MTSQMEEADDRFAGIDIDSLLNGQRRPLSFERKKALYEAPEFIQRLNGEETVMEGQSLCIECKIRGFPVPRLRWFKDDEEIVNHPRIHVDSDGIGGYYLFIEHVAREDEAAYRCRAENVEGACSSFFFLSVTGQPKRDPVPSWRTVSYPPMFSTIMEKVEEEEKQGKEFEELPPSPLTEFYYALTLKSRSSWPTFLGDWAFVNNRHPFRRHSSFSDSDDIAETEEDDEEDDANSDAVFIPNDDVCEKLKYHNSNKAHFAAKRGSRTNAKSKTKKQKLGTRADQEEEKGHTINENDRSFENKNERNKSKTEHDLEIKEIQKATLLENSELEFKLHDPHATKEEMRRMTKEEIAMPSLTFYKDTKDSDIITMSENNNNKERDIQSQEKADSEKKTRNLVEPDGHTLVTKNKEQDGENVCENTKQTSTALYNGTEADNKSKENRVNTQLLSNYTEDDRELNRQKIPEKVYGKNVEKSLSNIGENDIHNSSNHTGLNTNSSYGTAPEPKPLRIFRLDMPESGSLVNQKESRLSPNVESSFRYHIEPDRYEKSPVGNNVESERKEKSPFRYNVESERDERSPVKYNVETQGPEKSRLRYNFESERNEKSPLRYNVESERNERSPFRYTVESDRTERSPVRYNVEFDRNEKSPFRYTAESDRTERSPFRYTPESDRSEKSPFRYTPETDRTERSPFRYNVESDRNERSPFRYNVESARTERSPFRYNAESDRTERSPFRYTAESDRSERSPFRYTAESDRTERSPFRYTVENERNERSPLRYTVESDRNVKSPFRYTVESEIKEKSPFRYNVEFDRNEKSPSRHNVESERKEKSPFRYGQQNSEECDSGTYQLNHTKYKDTRRQQQQTQVKGKDRLEELRQQEIRRMDELRQEEQKRLEELKHEGETNTYKYKRTQIQYGDVRERERKQIEELRRKEQFMRDELQQKEQQQLEDLRRREGSLIEDMKLKERAFSDQLTCYQQEQREESLMKERKELRLKEHNQMEELKERESIQKEEFIAKESVQIEDMKAYEQKFIDEMKFKDRKYYEQAENELQKEEAEQEERKKMKERERSLQVKKEHLRKEQLRRQFEEERQKRLKNEEEAKRQRILRLDIAKDSKFMNTVHKRNMLLREENILHSGNIFSNKSYSNTETKQRPAFIMKSMEDTDLSTTLVQNSKTCASNSSTNSLDRRSRKTSDNFTKSKNDGLFSQRSSVSEKQSFLTDINNKENDVRYTNRTFGDRKPESTSTSVNSDMSSASCDTYSKPSNQSKAQKPLSFASFFAIEESRVAKTSLRTHEDLFKLAESIAAKRERFNEYISQGSSEDTTSSLPTQKEKMPSFQDRLAENTQGVYSRKEEFDSSNCLGKALNVRYLSGTEHSADKNNPEPYYQTKSLSRPSRNNLKEGTAAGSSVIEIRPFVYNSSRTTARRFHKTE